MRFVEHLLRITRTNLTDIFRPCKACNRWYTGINGPKPVGPGPSGSGQVQKNFRNLEPARTRTEAILEIPDQLGPEPRKNSNPGPDKSVDPWWYIQINEFIFSIIWIHQFQKTHSQWQCQSRHEIRRQPWQRRSVNPRTNLMTKSWGGDVPRPVRNSKIVKLFPSERIFYYHAFHRSYFEKIIERSCPLTICLQK